MDYADHDYHIFLSKIIEVLGQNICSILFSLMNGYFLIYFLSHFYVIRTGPVFGGTTEFSKIVPQTRASSYVEIVDATDT